MEYQPNFVSVIEIKCLKSGHNFTKIVMKQPKPSQSLGSLGTAWRSENILGRNDSRTKKLTRHVFNCGSDVGSGGRDERPPRAPGEL